jgi:hypothetical protein
VLEVREKALLAVTEHDPRPFWLPRERADPIDPVTGFAEREDVKPGATWFFELPGWLCKRHRQLCSTTEFEEAKAKFKSWKKKAAQW